MQEFEDLKSLADEVERELGVRVPYFGSYGRDWEDFILKCELRDFLDFITLAWKKLNYKREIDRRIGLTISTQPEDWLLKVSRILAEENVCYRLDERGGVHFSIDREFEANRVSVIRALGHPRYANIQNEFEMAHAHLSAVPPDGKNAIRSTFSAAEGLFRLMFRSAPRLGTKEIREHLAPATQQFYADDPTAQASASKLLASFVDWVDAAHFFRHEAGKEERSTAPLSRAVNMVSLGASYIRWLAEIDALQPEPSISQTNLLEETAK